MNWAWQLATLWHPNSHSEKTKMGELAGFYTFKFSMNNLCHEKFLEKGYDDLETISTLSTEDLKSIL